MTDTGYTVTLRTGDTHHYDNVVATDGGWLKCFIYRSGQSDKMVVFPRERVEQYETADVIV